MSSKRATEKDQLFWLPITRVIFMEPATAKPDAWEWLSIPPKKPPNQCLHDIVLRLIFRRSKLPRIRSIFY
jgi:hypothetical protein